MLALPPFAPRTTSPSTADRRAILAAVVWSAFRHPARHRLVVETLRSGGRFAYLCARRAAGTGEADAGDPREIRRFFDPEGDHGEATEFFPCKGPGPSRKSV